MTDPPEPGYPDLRRWCLSRPGPITPSNAMREFRVGWNHACRALEELERDHVLYQLRPGEWTAAASRESAANRARRSVRKEGGSCAVCGWRIDPRLSVRNGEERGSGVEIHHIVPVSAGGTDNPANLVPLCGNHHALAHILFPVIAGQYFGPHHHQEIVAALRSAEADPAAYLARLAADACKLLPRDRMQPVYMQPTTHAPKPPPAPRALKPREKSPPLPAARKPLRPRKALPAPSLAQVKRHLFEKHHGAIFDCVTCAAIVTMPAPCGSPALEGER